MSHSPEQLSALADLKSFLDSFSQMHSKRISISLRDFERNSKFQIERVLDFIKPFQYPIKSESEDLEHFEQTPNPDCNIKLDVAALTRNVVCNSFLVDAQQKEYLDQLEKCISDLFRRNPGFLRRYTHKNILQMVNLQVPLSKPLFDQMPVQHRLRLFCIIFAKYVKKDTLLGLCKQFWSHIPFKSSNKIKAFLRR